MMYRNTNPLCPSGTFGYWNDLNNDGTCNGEAFFGLNNFGFIYEKDSYKPKTYYTVIRNNFKKLTLVSPLKRGAWTNSDTDSLTDWQEFDSGNSMLAWDSDNEPVLPTLKTVLKLKGDVRISNELTRELNGLDDYLDVVRVAPFLSDPTVEDTDGDGYSDYVEIKNYSSSPLHNDVEVISLKSDYISIDIGGVNPAYGGYQGWFENEPGYEIIDPAGCGLIAMADVCLYLAKKDFLYCSDLTNTVAESCSYFNEPILKSVYMNYVKNFNDRYVDLHMRDDWLGEKYNMNNIDGNMDEMLTDYFKDNNISLSSKSYSSKDSKLDKNNEIQDLESFKEICKQIKNDFPVIIDIGKGKNENDLVPLYIKNDSGAFQYEYAESTDEHYITITGVIIDNIQSSINPNNAVVYRIATWGKENYYVFASDLYYHLTTGNNLLNDIENHFSNNITIIEKR